MEPRAITAPQALAATVAVVAVLVGMAPADPVVQVLMQEALAKAVLTHAVETLAPLLAAAVAVERITTQPTMVATVVLESWCSVTKHFRFTSKQM